MSCSVLAFVVLFVLPIAAVTWLQDPASRQHVVTTSALAVLAFAALLLLLRLLRRLPRGRMRRPSARALAKLDWPSDLTRAEVEAHCAAWLRARGWQVTLTTNPDPAARSVYIMATRGAATIAVLCDHGGKELYPAIIRTFAKESAAYGATRTVLLTMARGKLPHPAEAAAREAGVRLLRVAELPDLDTLASAEPAAAEPAAAGG